MMDIDKNETTKKSWEENVRNDLISYLKSFGTEPTNRVLKPKVVTLPPPALSIASQTTPNTYDHISLPLQARDIADLVFSGSTSANRNQVWITKPSINIRNNDFNETISNTIKPDIMRSMGFNLRPTDCELKLLGMRLLFTNASASESTISLEQSSKSVTTAEPQQCLATVAIQVQSRYTGGEINLRAAQDVSSSSNTSLPSHDYDLSVTSNPSHEWSTVMLCWTDPYDLSQAALSSGCLLRLEYGLFLTSMRTSKGQGLNIESLMSMIGTGGQSVTQSKIIPFGILLVGTYDDSRQYIARGHEALKSRLTDGDQRLLDTIVAANESLPDSERCSIKLASVKLRYKSYAPVTSAKRPGLYGQSLPRANRYYGDSENENSDDEDEDEDEDDEVEDGYEGRYFPTHYYGYPTSSFSGDQQIAINQCLHGFSIRSFEDVHNNVVSAKYHSPHTEQRSDDPSKWNFDFTGALTQLRSDAVSESVGDKRKRDLSNASDGGQVGVVLDDDDDDDVVFMGFTSPSLVLPHMRENCGEFVFSLNGSSTENLKTCEKCFCYICDASVASCPCWTSHCCAGSKGTMAQYWKSARELWLKKRSEGLTNDQIVSDELNNIVLFDSGGNSNANTCAKIVSDWKNGKTDLTMLMITMWPASREISMVGLTTAIRSLKSVPSEEYFLTVLNEMKLCLDDEKKTVLDQFIQHTNHLIATLKKDFEFYDGAKEVLTNIIPTLLYRVDMNWSNYGAFYYSSNSNPILHGTTIKLLAEMLGFYKYKEELVEILLTNCTGPLSARMRYHFFRLLSDAMITRNDSNADSSIIRKFVEHAMLALESDLVLETEYEKKLLHLLDTGGYTDLIEKYKELVIKDSSLSVTNYLEIFGSLQNQKPATSPTAISSSSAAVAVAVPPPPTAHREVINKFLSQKVFQLITTDSPITTEFLAGLESKISTFTSFLNIIFLHSDTEDNSNDKVIQGVVTIIQGRQMTSLQIIIDHFSKDNLYLKIPKSARPCFNSVVHSYANMLSRETSLKDTLSNIFSNNWKILEILLRLCGFTIRTVYVNCLLESENRFALTEETMDYQEVFPIEGELMSDGTLTAVAVSKRLQIFGKIKGGLKEKSTVSLQNYYRIHEAKFNASGSKWVEDEYASVFLLILDAKHSKAAEKLKNTPPGAKASVNFGSHLPSNTSLSPGIVQFLRGNNVKEAFEFGCGVPAARTKVRELYMQLPQTLVPLVSISFYGTGRNTKITMEKKVPPQGHEIAKQTMADEQMLLTTVISCIKSKMMQCPDKAKIELHAYSTPSYLASKLTNIFNCSENKETITKLLRETTLEQRIQTHSVLPNDILDKSSCYQRILDICPVICLALTLSPTAATTLTSSSSSSGLQLTPGILPLSSVSSNPSSAAPNLNSFLQTSEDLNAKIQKIQENLNTLQATLAGKQALPVSNLGSTESLLPPNTSSTSNSIPLTGHAKKKYRDLLTELIIHSHKSLFVHPSVLPAEWTKLVSNPMDLSKVCDLFDGNKLATVDDFASHVRLVFNNAINYNIQRPDDVGMRIRSGFAKKALEYFDKRLIEVTASFSTKTETEQANVSSTTISYFKSSIDEQVTASIPTLSTSTSHAMDADSFSIWTISRSK